MKTLTLLFFCLLSISSWNIQAQIACGSFVNPSGMSGDIYHFNCIDDIIFDGSCSTGETDYHLRISEFDVGTWTFTKDYYEGWTAGTAPNNINISSYFPPDEPTCGKIYILGFNLGPVWTGENFFFTLDCQETDTTYACKVSLQDDPTVADDNVATDRGYNQLFLADETRVIVGTSKLGSQMRLYLEELDPQGNLIRKTSFQIQGDDVSNVEIIYDAPKNEYVLFFDTRIGGNRDTYISVVNKGNFNLVDYYGPLVLDASTIFSDEHAVKIIDNFVDHYVLVVNQKIPATQKSYVLQIDKSTYQVCPVKEIDIGGSTQIVSYDLIETGNRIGNLGCSDDLAYLLSGSVDNDAFLLGIDCNLNTVPYANVFDIDNNSSTKDPAKSIEYLNDVFYIAGESFTTSSPINGNTWIGAFDINSLYQANLNWLKIYDRNAVKQETLTDLDYSDGYLYTCGQTERGLVAPGNTIGPKAYVSKTDLNGNLIWSKEYVEDVNTETYFHDIELKCGAIYDLGTCWDIENDPMFPGSTIPQNIDIYRNKTDLSGEVINSSCQDSIEFSAMLQDFDILPLDASCEGYCLELPPISGSQEPVACTVNCCEQNPDPCCSPSEEVFCEIAQFNYNLLITDCDVSLSFPLLDSCHQVTVDWGDLTIDGPHTMPYVFLHNYATSGVYVICILVQEYGTDGTLCYQKEYCIDIEVECPSIPDGCLSCPNGSVLGPELITNGNFSSGTTGFTSNYNFVAAPTLLGAGDYGVRNSTNLANGNWACVGNTTVTAPDSFLTIDGQINTIAYSVSTTVTPNTDYVLCLYLNNLVNQDNLTDTNPPVVDILINNVIQGTIIINQLPDVWLPFSVVWNSGINTNAIIELRQTTNQGYTDWAVDDVSFRECVVETSNCCTDSIAFCNRFDAGFTFYNYVCDTFGVAPNALDSCDYYTIDYGDGNIVGPFAGNSVPIPHIYTSAGWHLVCITVYEENDEGAICWEKTYCEEVYIEPCPDCCVDEDDFINRVNAGFTYATSNNNSTLTVTPNNLTNCHYVTWIWGDGSPYTYTQGNATATHTYNSTGIYQVCMLVEEYDNAGNLCWEWSVCKPIFILSIGLPNDDGIGLDLGWNLISFDVEPDNNSVEDVFESLGDNLEYITAFDNGALIYNPNDPSFLNTLTEVQKGFGYWVKTAAPEVLVVTGTPIEETYRKPLDEGWNLIGYMPDNPTTPEVYFSDLLADDNLLYLTAFEEGTLTYNPNTPPFLNSLTEMKNGLGYWVKVENEVAGKANNPQNSTNIFSFINGTTNIEDGEIVYVQTNDGSIVGELLVDYDGYLLTTVIYGDDPTTEAIEGVSTGENLLFRYQEEVIDAGIVFNGNWGLQKVELYFNEATAIPNITELVVNAYPNPAKDWITFDWNGLSNEDYVLSIYDVKGRIISQQSGTSNTNKISLNISTLSEGLYNYQIRIGDILQNGKFAKVK